MSRLIHRPRRTTRWATRITALMLSVTIFVYIATTYPQSNMAFNGARLEAMGLAMLVVVLATLASDYLTSQTFTNWTIKPVYNDRQSEHRKFYVSRGYAWQVFCASRMYGVAHADMGWRERAFYTQYVDRLKDHTEGDGRLLMYMRLLCTVGVLTILLLIVSLFDIVMRNIKSLNHYYTVNAVTVLIAGIALVLIVFVYVIGWVDADSTMLHAWAQICRPGLLFNWLLIAAAWLIRGYALYAVLSACGAPSEMSYQPGIVLTTVVAGTFAGYLSMLPLGSIAKGATMTLVLVIGLMLPVDIVLVSVLSYRLSEIAAQGLAGTATALTLRSHAG